jgi:hypothetical protein
MQQSIQFCGNFAAQFAELDRLTQYAAENHMRINYSYYARYSPSIGPAAAKKEKELKNGILSRVKCTLSKALNYCIPFARNTDVMRFLPMLIRNGYWHLAQQEPDGYPDISITGTIPIVSLFPWMISSRNIR